MGINQEIATPERYTPAPDFVEDTKDPLVDIPLTDSTELWLIQWPFNQLKPVDFHGKEPTLKLHWDGQLGSFEGSSGKTYDLVSHAAQEPDATVFMASVSESKVVGKISRRVCLVRYPEPGEFEKSSFYNPKLSSLKSGGSERKSKSHRDTLTSTHSIDQRSRESSPHSRKKRRRDDSTPPFAASVRSEEQSSHGSGLGSEIIHGSLGSEQSGEKSKRKKKMKVEQ